MTLSPAMMTSSPRQAQASSRWLPRTVGLSVALASGAVAMAELPLVAQASVPAETTFTFSGAVSGTLDMSNGSCTGSGGQFEFDGRTLRGSKARTWTVSVNTPSSKGGRWKKLTPNAAGVTTVSVVVQGQTTSKNYDWISKSGTITTSRSAGSINVTLGPDHSLSGVPGTGTVHLTGSWGCTSP